MSEGKLIIQDRDLALLRDLFLCRIMTQAHIAALHFSGKAEYTKKRLQQFKAAGYIGARKRHVTEPEILFLREPAFRLLKEKGYLANYPNLSLSALTRRANVSEATERHELAVMDVKAAFVSALKDPFNVVEFSTWPLLNEFSVRHSHTRAETLIRPDGYIHLLEGKDFEHYIYLEVDLSSEHLARLTSKSQAYLDFYKAGGFAQRLGEPREDYKDYPFRVFIVVKTEERRNNLAEALLAMNPPIRTVVWISTITEVVTAPLGAIWVRPLDYQQAVADSPYASFAPKKYGDARLFARDRFVSKKLSKQCLLCTPK